MAWETLEPKKKTEDGWEILDKSSAPGCTSLWEDIKIGAANAGGTLDTAVSMLAAADAAGREDDRDDIFANLDKRLKKYQELANPDKKEQGVMGKVAGNVATLPLQVLAFPLSPFSTGKTAIDSGESLSNAQKAIGIDSVGNFIGAALPVSKGLTTGKKILSGAGMNAAQDVGTKKAIQSVMDTEAGKKAFDPTMEDALVAGIVGAGMGAAFRNNDQRAKVERDKFAKLQEKQAARQTQAQADAAKVALDELDPGAKAIAEAEAAMQASTEYDTRPLSYDDQFKQKLAASLKGQEAQTSLEARQRALEDQVARQTSLDFNAAERARRENASTGYAEQQEALRQRALLENPREVIHALSNHFDYNGDTFNKGMSRGQRGAIVLGERAGKDVEKAKLLYRRKVSPAFIFQQTGVYRDVDGKYKTILSDNKATINEDFFHSNEMGNLSDFLNHPELFRLYPELKNIWVRRDDSIRGASCSP